MERASVEEGVLTRPLLVEQDHDINGSGNGSGNGSAGVSQLSSDDTSATLVLVFSTFVAVCSSFGYGCCVGYSSPAESGIMDDLGISLAEYSVFGSVLTVGGIIGAVTSGRIADLIGRRGAMWISDIFCTMGWFAVAFAKNAWLLDLGRLSMGFAAGLICYVVPVYIAEITPKNLRGGFTFSSLLMVSCGVSLMFFVGTLINWRFLALIGSIPCLIQLMGLFFIPESPRWLAKIGRDKELDTALQHLRGKTANISQESADIKNYTETFERITKSRILDLFQRRYAHSLIVGVGLMVLQQFGGTSAMQYYASDIFLMAGFSTSVGSIALAIIQIPVPVMVALLMDRTGRRPLLLVSAVGMFLSYIIVGLAFLLQDFHLWKEITPTLVFIGLLAYNAFFATGMGGIPWVIMSEIFPINVKGSAGSLVAVVSWFCALLVTYSFNFILKWSATGTFFIYSSICGATVIFIAKLVPETKGRTLEEIQASLTHFL